jgi:hypothetical protein
MGIRAWVLTGAITALALAMFAGCGSDETAGDEQTLTFTEGKGDFNPIGGASERSTPPGGGFVLSIQLEDDAGSSAGELHAVCVATREDTGNALPGTCSGTADLADGQLAINVGGEIGESVTGSIVGGSGDYAGATGTFESSDSKPPTDTFTFTLP